MQISAYVKQMNKAYPDLNIQEAKRNDMGQNNDVLVINRSLVFRFPKYKKGIDRLHEETRILEFLRGSVNLSIPEPAYRSFDKREPGKVFIGYPMIDGVPMYKESLDGLDNDLHLQVLSLQLVNFLIGLHAVSEKKVKEILPNATFHLKQAYTSMLERIQVKLFPYMRDDAQMEVTALFEDFLAAIDDNQVKPALIHGDFGASNILWDSNQAKITGIIDFGGSGLGDPAYDLAGILASYGKVFFAKCIARYPEGEVLSKRAVFYQQTFALEEALHGIENDDQQALAAGLKNYT
ncbi:aminoglycoside phosphotransferase family protein [Lentibacillus sp. N15]|uniref:phosphotransferase family protein n=1 Tax=Lentibacillus songyuanensis TaxID=3136161 RepID=UPI0031BADD51